MLSNLQASASSSSDSLLPSPNLLCLLITHLHGALLLSSHIRRSNKMDNSGVGPIRLSLHLLKNITNGFCEARKIGAGSYGSVYKGELENGGTLAVKLLHYIPGRDNQDFEKEYLNVASLKHKNVVRLIGYCHESQGEFYPFDGKIVLAEVTKRALCFEYLHNGGLDKYLSDASTGLDWRQRYAIIKGICHGLKYLHEELQPPMYHLDLKPANVLMDENMDPKIADFGLSRLFGGEKTQMSTSAIGTRGYIPPEYIDAGIISNKFDVFSLGVVIIKIMTGPTGYYRSEEMSAQEFIELVDANWRKRLHASSLYTLDSYSGQAKKCIEISLDCLESDRNKRPSIGLIVNMLNETETVMRSPDKSVGSSMNKGFPQVLCPDVHPIDQIVNKLKEMETLMQSPDKGIGSSMYKICHCISTETEFMDNPLNKLISYTLDVTDNTGRIHHTTVSTVCCAEQEPIRPNIKIIDCGEVCAIDVHPVEPWILVGHLDGHVSIWNHETQERLMRLKFIEERPVTFMEEMEILCIVRFIPRKQWFIVSASGYIHVYTYTTKLKLKEFKAHEGHLNSLVVHPTNPFVLSSSIWDQLQIKLWNWENGWECVRIFQATNSWVSSLKFNPLTESNSFASAHGDGTVKIWSMLSDSPITALDLTLGLYLYFSVHYFIVHGSQEYIVVGSYPAGTIQIWELETKTCVRQVKEDMLQAENGCAVLNCLPEHPVLVTVSYDGVSYCNSTTHRYQNMVDFKLGDVKDIAFIIKGTKSLVVQCSEGIAIMEIS